MRSVLAALFAALPLLAAPVPKADKTKGGVIYLWTANNLTLWRFTPDGERLDDVELKMTGDCYIRDLSPGGKVVVLGTSDRSDVPPGGDPKGSVYFVELAKGSGKLPPVVARGWRPRVGWSADGGTAFVTVELGDINGANPPAGVIPTETISWNAATGKTAEVSLPDGRLPRAATAAGDAYLTDHMVRRERHGGQRGVVQLTDHKGGNVRSLTDADDNKRSAAAITLHPDGSRAIIARYSFETQKTEYAAVEVEGGKETPLDWRTKLLAAGKRGVSKVVFAPTPDRILVQWDGGVGVCDLSGDKLVEFVLPKGKGGLPPTVVGMTWR